jgi:plasmid segregation protein ParM
MSSTGEVVFVGVDDGFRQTKIVTSTGIQFSIPSLARSGFALTAIGGEDAGTGGYETENRQFTVDAEIDGEDTRFDDYAVSDINRVLVNHVIQLAGLSGQSIRLATGLPFEKFFMPGASEPNQALINRKKNNLAIEVRPLTGALPPCIVGQQVTAQGLAAYVEYLTDDLGNIRAGVDPSAPVAILDIGGRTTDVVTVFGGGKLDHQVSGTGNVGNSDVYDHNENALKSKFQVSRIRQATLDRVARDQRIRLRGQDHDITDLVGAAVDAVGSQIIREIKRSIGDAAEMESVLLVGGGAVLMERLIRKEFPHSHVPADPEYANAKGMLKYVRFMA